jgi:hypothetical protein
MQPGEPPTNQKRGGYLVKTVWTLLIFSIGCAIQVAISNGSGKAFPLVSMVMGVAILGVWKWSPGTSGKSELTIKPLDKEGRDEH